MESFSWQDKNEDGQKVIYRALHFANWWQLEVAPKVGRAIRDEVEYEPAEFTEEIWRALRGHLWRKYLRRRVSWGMVEHIDAIIEGKATNERSDDRKDSRKPRVRTERPRRKPRTPRNEA